MHTNLSPTARIGLAAALLAAVLAVAAHRATPPAPPPPTTKPTPAKPTKPNCPNCPNCPRSPRSVEYAALAAPARPQLGGRTSPDGRVSVPDWIQTDGWPRNIASKGLGCCGFRVLDYAARVQGVPELVDLPEQLVEAGIPGGAYPEKVMSVLHRFAPDQSYFSADSDAGQLLAAALKSGRLPACSYNGHDPHYAGSIAHCVNVAVYDADADWVCIVDNNFPAEGQWVWMSTAAFKQRCGGWVYGLLAVNPTAAVRAPHRAGVAAATPADWQPLFGRIERPHRVAGDAVLNGKPSTVADIVAAIGPEMRPISVPPIEVDHKIDLEGLKSALPHIAAALMIVFFLKEIGRPR